jgi:hypothetical protein
MNDAYLKTFFWIFPSTFVIALILYGVGFFIDALSAFTLALSFTLGSIVSVMLASMNYRSFTKYSDAPEKWVFVTRKNYLVRYAIYGLILSISYLSESFYFLSVFSGFF